jgi:alkylation response protein AidB-like acyl-CoA dehydrogenase
LDPAQRQVAARLRDLAEKGAFDLPRPGGGATRERFAALWSFGAEDLSVGRLAEAHTDAVAIKAEAGLDHDPRLLLGVWASGGPSNRVVAEPMTDGWRLRGRRSWCSGAALLDQALLTVDAGDEQLLLTVDLDRPELVIDPTTWKTPALAASATATVTFDGVVVPTDGLVGGPGFYGDRPGFWAGSVGVAAVWAGGADGVVAALREAVADDPHVLAHLGAAEVASWTMQAALAAAADEIDADPLDSRRRGAIRALSVRQLVERSCQEIVDRSGRALGPGPLVADHEHAQRVIDLQLYVRQGHAERDLEAIGRATWSVRRPSPGPEPTSSNLER